mmetsp:Transcript_4368/g.12601  ORF Transcript_4368/g.12601 Transcript_4368/m.12601 type:complete len:310 (-) Transcript_4368:405-1334(-)
MASSATERPASTRPSTGMRSPGRMRSTSPGATLAVGTWAVSAAERASKVAAEAASLLLESNTMRDCSGMSAASDRKSAEARRRARASKLRPSSTMASSMTGSSRNPDCSPTPGTTSDAPPARNDVAAPSPIREFMSGWPLQRDATPLVSSFRPGPRSAMAPRVALTAGVPRACISGVCAYSCHPIAWAKWPTWWAQHTATRPQAMPRSKSPFLSSCCLASSAAFAEASSPPSASVRGCAGNPWEVSSSLRSADNEAAAGLCTETTALPVTRFTAAECTSGRSIKRRLTPAAHPPHFIPLTSSKMASVAG